MAMPSSSSDWLFIGVIAIAGIICVAYLVWFNFFRRKKEDLYKEPEPDEDSAFNALYQARSIVNLVRSRGADTSQADRILREAEREMERKRYTTVIALAKSAKSIAQRNRTDSGPLESSGYDPEAGGGDGYEEPDGQFAYKEFPGEVDDDAPPVARKEYVSAKKMPAARAQGRKAPAGRRMSDAESAFLYSSAVPKPTVRPDRTESILKAPPESAPAPAQSESDSFRFRQKMPEYFMEAKFEIQCAEQAVANARSSGRSTADAEKTILAAKALFDNKNYIKALSVAIRAKKQASGGDDGEIIDVEKAAMEPPQPQAQEPDVPARIRTQPQQIAPQPPQEQQPPAQAKPPIVIRAAQQQKGKRPAGKEPAAQPAPAPSGQAQPAAAEGMDASCASCGVTVSHDDNFCRKCGKKIEIELRCRKCRAKLDADDVFCRKCGSQVGSHGPGTGGAEEVYKCPECHSELPPNSAQCPVCGAAFEQ